VFNVECGPYVVSTCSLDAQDGVELIVDFSV